ncbi:MAG: Uma2 family endonuclease [Nitrospirae bacterium YQR-1]
MQIIERDFDLTEIINGEEVMGPSPFRRHQDIVTEIAKKILFHLEKHNSGKLYFSPLDVIFEEGINRLQPDLLFIKKENSSIEQDWIRGVPDMVCEIISQGSYEMDTEVKKAVYEKYRVPEYWIVMPELQTIQILTIEGDKYRLHSVAAFDGIVASKAIDGLAFNVMDIFA